MRLLAALLLLGALPAHAAPPKKPPAAKAAPKAAPPPAALPRLDEEEYAVIAAVVGDRDAKVLVFHETIDPVENRDTGRAEAESPDLEQKTVDSFRERNRRGGRLEARFGRPTAFISREEQHGYWNGVSCEAGWSRYYAAHPGASGILDVSRVGINHDHTQALVYFGGQGHCLAGGGALYELEKFHGKWKVVQVFQLWIS